MKGKLRISDALKPNAKSFWLHHYVQIVDLRATTQSGIKASDAQN